MYGYHGTVRVYRYTTLSGNINILGVCCILMFSVNGPYIYGHISTWYG